MLQSSLRSKHPPPHEHTDLGSPSVLNAAVVMHGPCKLFIRLAGVRMKAVHVFTLANTYLLKEASGIYPSGAASKQRQIYHEALLAKSPGDLVRHGK